MPALRLANQVFGGGASSRLFMELRERHSAGGVLDDAQWCDRGAGELGACAALVQQVNEVEGVADRLRALAEPGAKAVPGRLRAATEAAAAAATEVLLAARRGLLELAPPQQAQAAAARASHGSPGPGPGRQ